MPPRPRHLFLSRRPAFPSKRSSLRIAATAVGLAALVFATPSGAKTIVKIAQTKLTFSIVRSADGTVTAKATYTSPEPRCLSSDRWKQYPSGEYKESAPEFGFYYGGSSWAEAPGPPGIGAQLAPISPLGRSPLVWQKTWPGSASVVVENHRAKTEAERSYRSTVAAALGIDGGASTGSFEDKYKSGENKILLKCRSVTERVNNQLF